MSGLPAAQDKTLPAGPVSLEDEANWLDGQLDAAASAPTADDDDTPVDEAFTTRLDWVNRLRSATRDADSTLSAWAEAATARATKATKDAAAASLRRFQSVLVSSLSAGNRLAHGITKPARPSLAPTLVNDGGLIV